jgi:crotonobetainyl-CoA:carnitine CoA-transferase CaiB-like acyl-CoA transferase
LKYQSIPYRFSEIQRESPASAPILGQHNEQIFCGRLSYTKRDLAKLEEAGVI